MSELILDKEKLNSVLATFAEGKFQEALISIEALKKDYPNESILFNIRGACLSEMGNFDDAVKSYKVAISLNPDYAKAYFNLAGTHHDMGDLDASVEAYKIALQIEPNNEAILNNLGNVYRDQ